MKLMNQARKYLVPAAASTLGVIGSAHAALPEAVGTTVTAIQSDASALFALVFPVVGVVLGLMIVIKLFKRFGNKI